MTKSKRLKTEKILIENTCRLKKSPIIMKLNAIMELRLVQE